MLNLIVLALMVTASPAALAQGAGPGGPPPSGPPQGGGFQRQGPPQGAMRGMGMGSLTILGMPEVQVELKLTDAQKDEIKKLMPQRGPGGPGGPPRDGGPGAGPGGPPPQGGAAAGPGGPPPQGGQFGGPGGPNRGQEIDKKLKEILDAGQYKRYHELELQFQGPSSALRPDIGQKLGINDEQRQKMMEVMQTNRPQPRDPNAAGERPDPEKMFVEMEARREKINREIFAIFTAEQKSKWAELTGKEFKFNRRPPRGGGGGGR